MAKTKKLRAVRHGEGWQIKQGADLLYMAFVDRVHKILHVSPTPDTIAALESGRRYHKNLMGGRWQGTDPDGNVREIKETERRSRLEAIHALCLPFPNIGDPVDWEHPVSREVLRGTVLEVAKDKRGVCKAWVETADGKRHCVPRIKLTGAENEAKATPAPKKDYGDHLDFAAKAGK
jgi:hypothetical protein